MLSATVDNRHTTKSIDFTFFQMKFGDFMNVGSGRVNAHVVFGVGTSAISPTLGTPRPHLWIMLDCPRFLVFYIVETFTIMKRYFLILALLCLAAFCGCRKDEIAGNDSTSTPASSSTPPSASADDVEEEDFGSF